jgi:Domain of unknown function (DUF4129)
MNQRPTQPENEQRIHPLFKRPTQTAQAPSLGEILLPFLFSAMEASWIDAILIGLAGFDIFQAYSTLVPLWTPFVLLLGTQLTLTLLEQRTAKASSRSSSSSVQGDDESSGNTKNTLSGSPLLILFVTLITLCITWSSIYSQTAIFFDPRWLFSMLNDILLFNQQAYHLFIVVALSLYLCWRSVRLLYRRYEPSHVFGEFRIGMAAIIVVILLRAGQASAQLPLNDELTLLLLVPIFLFFSLSAHAFARISFVRHNHPVGLEGDANTHERAVLMTIGIAGITFFIIALLVGTTLNSAILVEAQQLTSVLAQLYNVFTQAVAYLIVILLTPIFWLFSWWFSLFPPQAPHVNLPKGKTPNHQRIVSPHPDAITAAIIPFIKIIIPVLLIVLAVIMIRWIIRRRRNLRATGKRKGADLHESLWSWNLFWHQFKALLRSLFGRFFPQKQIAQEPLALEGIHGGPSARSIREVYRALLRGAALRGYPRSKNETPNEFQQRLDEKTPLAEPQLSALTDAYIATRYGGVVPAEADVAQVRQQWTALEQKWRQPKTGQSRHS